MSCISSVGRVAGFQADQSGDHLQIVFHPVLQFAASAVAIEVEDSGIGIAPENHEKIFEDFRQVDDSPSRQYGGTGLGLAMCRRLANALGGRITVTSNLGRGSVFTLTIPVDIEQ